VTSRKLNPNMAIFRQPGIFLTIPSFMNLSCHSSIPSLLQEHTLPKKCLFTIHGFAFKVCLSRQLILPAKTLQYCTYVSTYTWYLQDVPGIT
jgi:hypothetical protein